MSRRLAWIAVLLSAVLIAGCGEPTSTPSEGTRTTVPSTGPSTGSSTRDTPSAASAAPSDRAADVRADDLASGLSVPWGLVALDDASILIGERDSGRIVRIAAGGGSQTLATLTDVRPGGEGGLLGLALTPDATRLFAYFTAATDNRIVAMSWDGSRLGAPTTVLTGIPKGSIHNGGRMAIGPDGFLYVGTGETGDKSLAQDLDSLGGKILRLTLEGRPAPGNPFDSAVWSYGHRNVQGLAFDGEGRLWASEFGQNTWDELNLITKGADYGWPSVEGSGNVEGMTDPIVVWHTGDASPSGLAFWRGELWMASLRGARLWEIPVTGAEAGEPVAHFTGDYGRLRSVVPTTDGGALLVTTNNTDGRGRPRDGDDRILRVTH
jgi:glucose/arabinose dehydrogenase